MKFLRRNQERARRRSGLLIALALVASTLTGVTVIADVSAAAAASRPTVNGWVISWSDDGWYQVQTRDGSRNVCEGGRSCNVKNKGFPAGTYKVINHSTNQRWADIKVSGSSGGSPPSGSDFTRSVPKLTEAKYNGTYVSLRWERLGNQKGVNIYRNGRDIKKSINSGTVFNDYDGKSGDTYYIVAYNYNGELSKKSHPPLETGSGGEVSGVRNLKAKMESSTKVKLTWKATSTAVSEWRIYQNDKHWRTVKADKKNPGRTYTYYDWSSTGGDVAAYWIRPVGETKIVGRGAVVASPRALALLKTERSKATNGYTPPPPRVPAGNSGQSQALANELNDANQQASEAAQDARASAIDAGVDIFEAVRAGGTRPNPNGATARALEKAGDSFAAARMNRYRAKKAAAAAVEARRFYDACRGSSSCWNGSDGGGGDGCCRSETTDNDAQVQTTHGGGGDPAVDSQENGN